MSDRFAFGENWRSFLSTVGERHVEEAMDDVRAVFGVDSLDGETFVDVGCGSGLFSLAAHRLDAGRVVSFDFDEDAVACCEYLRYKEEEGTDDWTVTQGSILDSEFVASLGRFDYVYCWGVVHHTGAMWDAIDNTTKLVDDGGLLCLGVYNEVGRDKGLYNSHTALKIKRLYNRCPGPVQSLMVVGFGLAHLTARTLIKRESPFAYLERFSRENRGMDYWHDVRDWLGGLPFEFASPSAVESYVSDTHEDIEHRETTIRGRRPGSVNTYLFQRTSQQ